MRTRVLLTGTLLLAVCFGPNADAKDDRPNLEPGGLFSLFGGGSVSATPTPAGEELGGEPQPGEEVAAPIEPGEEGPSAAEAPAKESEPATAAEDVPPAVAEPAAPAAGEAEVAEPPTERAEEKPTDAEKSPEAAIAAPEAPLEKPSEKAAVEPEAVPPAASQEVGKAAAEEPAWPSASDTGGGAGAGQPTAEPGPEATPEASVASVEPLPVEPPPLRDDEEAMRARQEKPSPALDRGKDEIAAREIPPAGGSVAPGAVSLPETEIQGELEKPDIFFLLPKARDQSDDQVIRARIRREITQPLVKEWLEEMMLLK